MNQPDHLQMMEDVRLAVDSLTGVKAQFVAAGWSQHGAEQMAIELFRSAMGTRPDTPTSHTSLT